MSLVKKFLLAAVALFLFLVLAWVGGCVALGAYYSALEDEKVRQGEAAMERARNASLPPHVQRLVDEEFLNLYRNSHPRFSPLYSDVFESAAAQDPSGRYMLTSVGLFDFAMASFTPLDCPKISERTGYRVSFRKRWLDDRLFLWGRCVYDLATLQPGVIEDITCGSSGQACTDEGFTAASAPIVQESDRVYVNDREFLFLKLSGNAPIQVWSGYPSNGEAFIQKFGLTPIAVPSPQGRRILVGEHGSSPNGEYDASYDYKTLTVTRIQDGTLVAQVHIDDFHGDPANSLHRGWSILGWTDDSRQLIFLVATTYYRDLHLSQIFALNIP